MKILKKYKEIYICFNVLALLLVSLILSGIVSAQTPILPSEGRNYIQIFTPRDSISEAASLPFRSASEVQQLVQYFDGFGRPIQTVQTKGSPDMVKDIVQPVAYDELGREAKKYLPYATAVGDNSTYRAGAIIQQAAFYNIPPAGVVQIPVTGGVTPSFAQTVFEASPLNRVLEQGAPGATWQPAATRGATGRTVVSEHGTNNVTAFTDLANTRRVSLYGVSLSSTSVPTLTLNGAYAANQLYLTLVKDENWTVIDGRNGTVEEYKDKQGRVVLKRTFNKNHLNISEMLSTYYVYDNLGNLAFVLPPGINPDKATLPTAVELDNFAYRYRYDDRNRLVEKKLPGKGTEYIVYNQQDLPILTQDSIQRTTGTWLFSKYDAFGRLVMSGTATLAGSRKDIQDAADVHSTLWETVDSGNSVTGYRSNTETYPQTGITNYLMYNYYDGYGFPGAAAVGPQNLPSDMIKGLLTGSRGYTADGSGSYLSASYYDDQGRLTEMVGQNHINGMDRTINTYNFPGELLTSIRTHTGHGQTTVIGTSYSYDHMGRKLRTEQYIDDPAQNIVLSEMVYNEIGQLKEKRVHSENDGGTFLNTESYAYNPRGWLKQQSGPRFSLQLKYEDGTNPQYNGNISNQYWGTATNPTLHNYSYLYDRLNRLTKGISDEGFNETIDYDKMGNIIGLTRNPMGNSNYSYSGNRLTGISGALNSSYGYDANGNQTSDSGKGITIAYNYLNLPQTIVKASTSETMTNYWLATGAKIKKTVGGMTREYAGGIEYSDGTVDFIQTEEGRAIPLGGGNYSYEYMLKDHLGNTRVLLKEDGSVLETSDYYPFGLQVSRSGQTVPSPENRYKYNGKELQTELGLGQYDYGARFYDPVIGRWNVVDPMAEIYSSYSPYVYVGNDPILFHDPNGMYRVDSKGNITIDDSNEISAFLNYMSNNGGASVSDMSNHIFTAGNGFSWELDAVSVTGRGSYESGSWLSEAQNRISDAVDLMGNINTISTAHFGFENTKSALDIGGGLYGAFQTAVAPGNQWLGKNGKYYSNSWGGNQYTGSRSGAYSAARMYKWAGRGTIVASVLVGGMETYRGYQTDGGQFGYNTQKATASSVGGLVGGLAGAKIGTTTGAAVGVWFGVVGAVPGALIGGFIGGLSGSYLGSSAGEQSVNYYHGR